MRRWQAAGSWGPAQSLTSGSGHSSQAHGRNRTELLGRVMEKEKGIPEAAELAVVVKSTQYLHRNPQIPPLNLLSCFIRKKKSLNCAVRLAAPQMNGPHLRGASGMLGVLLGARGSVPSSSFSSTDKRGRRSLFSSCHLQWPVVSAPSLHPSVRLCVFLSLLSVPCPPLPFL